jgi:glycosyltransferase involved in cell wall biosynthesis
VLLSVIVPAYREERTIAEVLRRVGAVDLAGLDCEIEVVVCDDGSDDGTAREVERAISEDARVRLLRHTRNQGKGAAIRTALEAVRGEFVLIQDADLEYDPQDYPALLEPAIAGAPVVYGSRFLGTKRPEGMEHANFVANRVLASLCKVLYGLDITDEATCFKLFRTDVLRSLDLECTRFEFCPEVTAKLALRGVPIVEVPIRYQARSHAEGKKIRWTDGVEAAWVLVRHRLPLRKRPPSTAR